MSIIVQCESCNFDVQIRDDRAGKTERCPRCGLVIAVPAITPTLLLLLAVVSAVGILCSLGYLIYWLGFWSIAVFGVGGILIGVLWYATQSAGKALIGLLTLLLVVGTWKWLATTRTQPLAPVNQVAQQQPPPPAGPITQTAKKSEKDDWEMRRKQLDAEQQQRLIAEARRNEQFRDAEGERLKTFEREKYENARQAVEARLSLLRNRIATLIAGDNKNREIVREYDRTSIEAFAKFRVNMNDSANGSVQFYRQKKEQLINRWRNEAGIMLAEIRGAMRASFPYGVPADLKARFDVEVENELGRARLAIDRPY